MPPSNRWSRREFLRWAPRLAGPALCLAALAACTWTPPASPPRPAPLTPKRLPRVGMLKQPPMDNVEDFRRGMRELGYAEGRDFQFDLRYVEQPEELAAQTAELVRAPVDIIVAPNTAALRAAQRATATIPVVMVTIVDPVAGGFVASLDHPGGNITGPSQQVPGLTGKRLQLLQEVVPRVRRVAVFWVPSEAQSEAQWHETGAAAERLGLDAVSLEVQTPDEFAGAFARAAERGAEAIFIPVHQLVMPQLPRIAQVAVDRRWPSMAFQREYTEAGGLMAYGSDVPALYRQAAAYVDKILKGAKPADLPVEQPTTFDFIVNLKTAKALGLAVPESVLSQATEVIQ